MSGGAADGGGRRGGSVRGRWQALAEAWHARMAERRAKAAARRSRPPGARLGDGARVTRSALGAALDARLAVRAGVRLDDFLRHRLARYAGRLAVPLEALPVTVDVANGEAVVRARSRRGPVARGDSPAAAAPAHAGWSTRELRDAEGALDALDARVAALRARLDGVERELAQAVSSGAVVASASVDATPEQLGRPPVPPAWPIHALRGFVAALVAAEAWRFSGAILAGGGISTDGAGALEAALHATPLATGFGLVFATGAAAAAFTFAWVSLARAADALATGADAGRRPLLLAAAAGAAALVPGVAAAAAAPERWAQLALLATVPFAGAALVRAASALDARRAAAEEIALGWDRERAREAVDRARREELWARAADELRAAEAERTAMRRKVVRLHRAAAVGERAAELVARAEAERLDRLAESLACALELDRYLFLRLSAARSHEALERPRARVVESGVGTERLGVAG